MSSASGSADVLEALGFDLELEPARIAQSIDELGFGFIFAPAHHPGFRHAAPVRRELGVRTVFNVLGPLTNPAGARTQIVGVYSAELAPVIADVLCRLGCSRAFVVHGAGGIDELSPAGPNLVCEVERRRRPHADDRPARPGRRPLRCPAIFAAATPEENAQRSETCLSGEAGPHRDAVLLNAAGAIAAAGHAADLAEGLALATAAIDSGSAASRLDSLVEFSRAEVAR